MEKSRPLICIDPGHGGGDSGAEWKFQGDSIKESTWNLQVSESLRAALLKLEWRIILTRRADHSVTLSERAYIANDAGADVLLSIHHNSFTTSVPHGYEIYFADQTDKEFADILSQKLKNNSLNVPSRGVKKDSLLYSSGLTVLRKAAMPAVLLEVAFLSNYEDRRACLNGWHELTVAASVQALEHFLL